MMPISVYNTVDTNYPYKLRGTNQQTDTGLIWMPPQYRRNTNAANYQNSSDLVRENGIRLGGFSLHNRSGGAVAVAIGVRIQNFLWKAGQWVESTTTYTDDTTDAQDAGTADFALETTTDNTGFVILSRVPFNAVSINVSTASVDATDPARAIQYSSGVAGHTWTTPNANILFASDGAAAEMATGENVWLWALPIDHTPTTADNGLGTGIPKGYYAVKLMATTAPDTTAALAATMEIFRMFHATEALADNGIYEAFYGASEVQLSSWNAADRQYIEYGDGVVAFFGTANDGNRITGLVRTAG